MGDATRALKASLGLAAAWVLTASLDAFEPLERLTAQARYLLRPPPGFTAPVTVVAIDEETLRRHGQMPWPREKVARLLERLHAGGARVVGVDMAFNEPGADPRADARLAAAIRAVPTVLPAFWAYAGPLGKETRLIRPTSPLAEAAVAHGLVQFASHQQAEPWELEPAWDVEGQRTAAFPVAVAKAFRGLDWEPRGPSGAWSASPWLIAYRGPAGTAPMVSAARVLDEAAPPPAVQGRIVLVGATATGLPDTNFIVPDLRNGPMAGVEIYAHVIDNLLADGFWRRFGGPAFALLFLLLALGPGRLLLRGAAPGGRRHLVWAASTIGWVALAIAAFPLGIWLEIVPVVGFLFSCHFLGLLGERQALLESRNRLLERYASDLASEARRQRERVEGELHDGVQQLLVALGRELRQVRKALGARAELIQAGPAAPAGGGTTAAPGHDRALDRLDRAEGLTEELRAEVMRVRADLLPPALRHEGLAGALPVLAHEMARRHGFEVRAEIGDWGGVAPDHEVELYWLVKEALNNVAKHAEPTVVTVRLAREGTHGVIEVVDDGKGFHPPDLAVPPTGMAHSGLHRMWLRMRGRGGDLTIRSRPGEGARLRFEVPLGAHLERPPR